MSTSNILPLSSVEKILHNLPLRHRIKADALRWLKRAGTDHRIKVSDLDGEFPSTLDRASVNRAINRLLDAINKAATANGIRIAAKISPNKRDGAAGRWIWFTGALADPNPPNTRELDSVRGRLYANNAVSGDPPIVVLLTFNSPETMATVEQFCPGQSPEEYQLPSGFGCNSFATLNGAQIIHCVPQEQGNATAQQICQTLIHNLGHRLRAIIAIGTGFGTDEKKSNANPGEKTGRQSFYDVLVSEAIFDYQTTKKIPPASARLVQRFKHITMTRKVEVDSIWSKVHFGTLLSVDYMKEASKRDEAVKACPCRVIGGETEGMGIYTAASAANPQVDWIIAKGIAGWGDERDSKVSSEEKKEAAKNAARVVYEVLSSGAPLYPPIPPNETASLQAINAPTPCNIADTRPLLPDLDKTRGSIYDTHGARGSQEKGIDREPDASEKGVDVLEAMKEWVQNKNGTPIFALLGEYGTGKTIACQRLEEFFRELRTTNSDLPQPLVLYFNLRNVPVGEGADRVPSLKDTLERCMRDGWLNSHDATIETIFSQIEDKTTVVIFDGLDEVLVKLSAAEGQQFARNLFSMADKLKFRCEKNTALKNVLPLKILVSCRTHYFRTLRDQQNLFTEQERVADRDKLFTTMILLPLGEEQIATYLRAVFPNDAKRDEMRNNIHAVHNLDELIRRPFLLKLVTDVLPKIEQLRATGKTIRGVTLYEEFAKRWLERDDGKHHIEAKDKPRLAMDLAAHFWGNSASNLSADEIEDWLETWIDNTPALKRRYDIRDSLTRARLSEDLRTANFLVRQDTTNKNGKIESSFRFAHTSFQEFFLAKYLFTAVKDNAPERWNIPLPSRETLVFLGQLFAEAADETTPAAAYGELPEWAQTRRPRVNELIFHYALTAKSENCPILALHSINLKGADLPDYVVEGTATQPLNLSNANFEGANLRRTEFHHVILQGSRFANAALTQTIFWDCSAAQTVWNAAECNATIWRKCSLTNSTWDNATGRGAQFLHCTDAPLPDKVTALEDVSRVPQRLIRKRTGEPFLANKILGFVSSCAWSPDGTRLLLSDNRGDGGNLQIRNAKSGKLLWKMQVIGSINSCVWSPDGKRLLSGSADGLQIWSAEREQLLLKIKMNGDVQSCAWSPNGKHLLAGSDDGLTIWDSESGKLLREIGNSVNVRSCAWSPDGTHLLSGSVDNGLLVWNAKNGKLFRQIKESTGCACAWSPDGTHLLSGDSAGLQVWNVGSGKHIMCIKIDSCIQSCAWSPDGTQLLSSTSGDLQIWDAKNGKLLQQMQADTYVYSCAWSPDGTQLLSGEEGLLQVWDIQSGKLILKMKAAGDVWSCVWSPDGTQLLSRSHGSGLQIWNAECGKLRLKVETAGHTISCAWSPNGTRLLSGGVRGSLQLWDTESGKLILKMKAAGDVWSCAWSPDGTRLLSGCRERALQIWDAKSGKLLQEMEATGNVTSCAWSPDGARLLSGVGGNLQVWNAEVGKLLLQIREVGHVSSCAWSPDGMRLLSVGSNNLEVWDASTGKRRLHRWTVEDVNSCAWSPDGTRLLSGGNDGNLQVWDAEKGELCLQMQANAWINSCAWSPDGKHLLSGDKSGCLQVWDAQTGKPIRQFFMLRNGSQLAWECATGKITHVAGKFWKDFHWKTVSSDGQRELLPIEAFGPIADD